MPLPDDQLVRLLADQAFSRAAGAPLVPGNRVRVLRNAEENYPAWESAMAAARHHVHIEMYMVHRDTTGNRFRDLLVERARAGVRVRLLVDWLGAWKALLAGAYRPIVAAGGELRVMNPPGVTSLLGWMQRDHRKLIAVDGEVAFVSGLCIGDAWVGDPAQGVAPWRDTGVELRGPAVADAERAFLQSWGEAGGVVPRDERDPLVPEPVGEVPVRVIATVPATANMLRLDMLVASLARRTLWLTDAYFIGGTAYIQSLQRAAEDGVDVRLLLPATSDLGWIAAISRTLYRPLLEAGVRVFEWSGSMLHAKTAVTDGRWTRVGSTNLNVSSWVGNWELDVMIEHEGVAHEMEAHFEEDMRNSTEVVESTRRRVVVSRPVSSSATGALGAAPRFGRGRGRHSGRRLVSQVTRLGSGLGAAVLGRRPLTEYEFTPLLVFGLLLVALALVGLTYPLVIAIPVAVFAGSTGLYLAVRAFRLRWRVRTRRAVRAGAAAPPDVPRGPRS